jgi:large subunit ribosomal protein L1
MRRSKRYQAVSVKVDKTKTYSLDEALDLLKETANAKFTESVDIAIKLGIDPKRTDQLVKGSVTLPYGTGKDVKVLVLTKGEKEKEAKEAQADYVGLEEYIEKIKNGWLDFDAIVATPDVMPEVGKLGKILGPKGLMPSPKTGTVTFDVGNAVRSLKAGKIQYKTDKTGNIHARIGRIDFEKEKLKKNIITFVGEILKEKPAGVKGQYLKSVTISSTMGPGIKLDIKELQELARKEL